MAAPFRQQSLEGMLASNTDTESSILIADENDGPLDDGQIAALGKVPTLLDGTFFRIINHTPNGRIVAKCMTCNKKYSGNLQITSNFLKHLKDKHFTMVPKYEEHKKHVSSTANTNRQTAQAEPHDPADTSRAVPLSSLTPTAAKSTVSSLFRKSYQKKADNMVTKLIINHALPMRLVEYPEFKELVMELSMMPEAVHCLSMKTVSKCIEEQYNAMHSKIVDKIQATNFVCTTADMWSSRRRSYLGVTVHWLNKSMERESYAIACTRFKGAHDFVAIARHLSASHQRYGLNTSNVIFTVTDNAANMVKTFKEFGIVGGVDQQEVANESGELDVDVCEDDEDASSDENEDCVEIGEIGDTGPTDNIDVDIDFLPQHIRCATHTLNLVVTVDVHKAVEAKLLTAHNFGVTFRSAMARCSQHWNLLNRSANKASEAFIAKFGHLVRLPCPTRWNSLFDALSDLIKLDPLKLHAFSTDQKLTPFTTTHASFLVEYVKCLAPISIALDKLQGENDLLLADLIPTILNANFLLEKLRTSGDIRYCDGLIQVLQTSLRTRFPHVFEWDVNKSKSLAFVMATVTTPALKLRWIDSTEKKKLATTWLLEQVHAMDKPAIVHESSIRQANAVISHGVYEFLGAEDMHSESESSVNLQVVQYMNDRNTQLTSLQKYALIERVFFKFNAGLPSSAPVERLFSFAGLVMTAKRTKLKDEKFEKLTLLKANAYK